MESACIRPATAADRPAIVALVTAGLAEFGFAYAEQTSEADLADLECSYAGAGGVFEVACDAEGRLLGCYGLRPRGDGTAKLRKMYVDRRARGRGLGRTLLRRALDVAQARGWTAVWLETTARMAAAQALYLSEGFQPIEGARAESPRCDRVYRLDLD